MMKTRTVRRDTSEPETTTTLWRARGGRRRNTSAVMWNAAFTAVQAWALLAVLALVHPLGVAHVALACAMAGAVMGVILAWARCHPGHRDTAGQRNDQPGQDNDQTDQRRPQGHATVQLRGRAKR